jgi:hypothetical protein
LSIRLSCFYSGQDFLTGGRRVRTLLCCA